MLNIFKRKYKKTKIEKFLHLHSTKEMFDNIIPAINKALKYALEYQSLEEISMHIYQDDEFVKAIKIATIRGHKFNLNGSFRDINGEIRYKGIKKKKI